MLLTEARRSVRVADGELVPLHEQDRGGWDRALIAEGHDLVRECLALRASEAAARSVPAARRDQRRAHRRAHAPPTPTGRQIATLYAQLYAVVADPDRRAEPRGRGRRARRARGRAGRGGPARRSTTYHAWHATRADLLRRLGRSRRGAGGVRRGDGAHRQRGRARLPHPAARPAGADGEVMPATRAVSAVPHLGDARATLVETMRAGTSQGRVRSTVMGPVGRTAALVAGGLVSTALVLPGRWPARPAPQRPAPR